MRQFLFLFIASAMLITNPSLAQEDNSLRWWLPKDRLAQKELEAALNAVPSSSFNDIANHSADELKSLYDFEILNQSRLE